MSLPFLFREARALDRRGFRFVGGSGGAATASSTLVSTIVSGLRASTVRGACAAPGHYVLVGEEVINQGNAFVIHSTDGIVWEDITMPTNPGSLSRCVIKGSALVVAGGGGYVARFAF